METIDVTQTLNIVFGRLKTLCKKGEKCWLQAFYAFPIMLSRAFFFNSLQNDKDSDWLKLKVFADHKIIVTPKLKLVFGRI